MKQFIFALIVVIGGIANAQSGNTDLNPSNLNKMSYEEANDAIGAEIHAIKTGQKTIDRKYIDTIVFELQQGNLNSEKKVLLIYFLGELRLDQKNVINALIDNIDLKAERLDPMTDLRRWGTYPAAEALIKIGKPTVNPILDDLPSENNELRRSLLCKVLKAVLKNYLPK